MADTKVSALTAAILTDVDGTDLLYFVDLDEAAAADRSKYLTIDMLFDYSFLNAYTAATPASGDFLAFCDINDSNLQKKVTLDNFFDYKFINTWDAKSALVSADELAMADSAASNVNKKVTIDNLFDYTFLTAWDAKASLVSADQIAIADSAASNVNKKATIEVLFDYKFINAFDSKATPVMADELTLADSAASNVNKKCTITQLAAIIELAAARITSGTLTHERGGLEADVSAYAGIPKISGGSTSEWKEKENTIALLASATVDLQNGDSKTTVYTVPASKKAVVTHVVIRNPTASLAGGTDFDFGDGANADTWKQTVDLSGMTGTDDYYVISNDNAVIGAVFDATDEFGVKPATGATADAQATMEVFGYEFDA